MNAELNFSHYALIQTGHCVFGVGATDDEAREDAAQWLDGGKDKTESIEAFSDMIAMRRGAAYGDLVIVPCTEAFAAHVETHGTVEWSETDEGICLPPEFEA